MIERETFSAGITSHLVQPSDEHEESGLARRTQKPTAFGLEPGEASVNERPSKSLGATSIFFSWRSRTLHCGGGREIAAPDGGPDLEGGSSSTSIRAEMGRATATIADSVRGRSGASRPL